MPTYQPPPTYAEVVLVDPENKKLARFNPIWLNWFLNLVKNMTPSGAGSGTVTDVSVITAQGFRGSVATSGTTPAITIGTTVTGLMKGDGTQASAATAGTDYQAPIGTISGIAKGNGANALTAATAGTDYLAPFGSQTANYVYASPDASAGVPSFRALVLNDIPRMAYASYADFTTQTAAVNTPQVITLNTTDFQSGVTLVSSSQIKVTSAGKYNFQFSAQLENTDAAVSEVNFWIRKNGTNIAGSNGKSAVHGKHSGTNGKAILSWNYILDLVANDYIEYFWNTDAVTTYLQTYVLSASPSIPSTPSMIVTVNQVA